MEINQLFMKINKLFIEINALLTDINEDDAGIHFLYLYVYISIMNGLISIKIATTE